MGRSSWYLSGCKHGTVKDCTRSKSQSLWWQECAQLVSYLRFLLTCIHKTRRTTQKTLLLLVIRHHVGSTPLNNLAQTLSAALNKVCDPLSNQPEIASR